jgi:hypothetical protein
MITNRLDRVIELLERTIELLGRDDRSTLQPTRSRVARRPARRRSGSASGAAQSLRVELDRAPLHRVIAAVLEQTGRPLSAVELAEQIETRGLFVGRRRGGSITANQVNSRVSNPHYRDQFQRRDGRIWLAGEFPVTSR